MTRRHGRDWLSLNNCAARGRCAPCSSAKRLAAASLRLTLAARSTLAARLVMARTVALARLTMVEARTAKNMSFVVDLVEISV